VHGMPGQALTRTKKRQTTATTSMRIEISEAGLISSQPQTPVASPRTTHLATGRAPGLNSREIGGLFMSRSGDTAASLVRQRREPRR
jgi:hypothetical protein